MAQAKQVFVSYDSADTDFAHRLAQDLRRIGVEVWIAPDSIRPGEGWVEAINRGLESSSHMVTVLTPKAIASEWVTQETNTAIALERKGKLYVIPLDVEECDPPPLWAAYQMITFRDSYKIGLDRLAASLEDMAALKEAAAPAELRPQPQSERKLPSMSQILERVREIIVVQCGANKADVQPETNLIYDLHADDLDMAEFVMEVEDEFDVSTSDDEINKLQTVRDWAAYIMQCLQG